MQFLSDILVQKPQVRWCMARTVHKGGLGIRASFWIIRATSRVHVLFQVLYPTPFYFYSFRKLRLRMVKWFPPPWSHNLRLWLRSPSKMSICDSCPNFPAYDANKEDREGETLTFDISPFFMSQLGQRLWVDRVGVGRRVGVVCMSHNKQESTVQKGGWLHQVLAYKDLWNPGMVWKGSDKLVRESQWKLNASEEQGRQSKQNSSLGMVTRTG